MGQFVSLLAYPDIERGKALLHGGRMSKPELCEVVNGEKVRMAKLEMRHVGSSNTAGATGLAIAAFRLSE